MSILFEETKKPRKKSKSSNNLAKLQKGGFADSNADINSPSPITDLFAPTPKAPKPPIGNKKRKEKVTESEQHDDLADFLNDNPSIKKYIILIRVYNDKNNAQIIKEQIVNSAQSNKAELIESLRKIAEKQELFGNEKHKLIQEKRDMVRKELPIAPPFESKALFSLYFYNMIRILKYKLSHLEKMNKSAVLISNLLSIAVSNPQDKEVKFDKPLFDSEINDFSSETKITRTNKIQKIIKMQLKRITVSIDMSKITHKCQKLFNEEDHFFIDKGTAESLFFTVIEQMTGPQKDYIEKCIFECLNKPHLCGKIIYNCTSNFLTVKSLSQDTMQYYFILFVRYFFSQMFFYVDSKNLQFSEGVPNSSSLSSIQKGSANNSITPTANKAANSPSILTSSSPSVLNNSNKSPINLLEDGVSIITGCSDLSILSLERRMLSIDISNFSNKVKVLFQHSPFELGFTENFLPNKYKTIALSAFPERNPYHDAIMIFNKLPYYTCPIDFCRTMHEGLKIVQSIASQISFNEKSQATGKVYAKSDHLLCLDDLFDITLIIMLISNPIPVFQLVETFKPFIQSLQMTSELEFAFTNINALIEHIKNLDIEKFTKDAKMRAEEEMEIDPLNILGKK